MSIPPDEAIFAAQWQAWHEAHERALGDPHGFLAVTAIHWLEATPARYDDAPGQWWSDEAGVHARFTAADGVEIEGHAVEGRHDFGVVAERASLTFAWRDAVIEVGKRGGRDIVRPRHPDAPLVTGYRGTPAYAPRPEWAIRGRYVAFETPRPTTVGSVAEGLQHVYEAPGRIEFDLGGKPAALTVFDGPGGGFQVLFRDTTSGVATYAANRSLSVGAPDENGRVILDFNRAVNLPCAYTDFATCPLPPAENTLSAAVEAGEKLPYERGGKP